MAPPPRTTIDGGASSVSIAWRFVQKGVPARPSMGGTKALVPVFTTTARRPRTTRSPTTTRRGPSRRPRPRTNRPPLPSKRSTATVSSQSSVASARMRCATGAQSGGDGRRARHARDAPSLGQQVGRPDHHLRRDAAPVGALPADQSSVDAHHLEAGRGQTFGDVLAAGAQAEHHDVDGVGHRRRHLRRSRCLPTTSS